MYLLCLGILLMLMKYLEYGPVAEWSWWWELSPFALAVAWWAWADATGYNKRREMEKMERRRQARREQNLVALGMDKQARRAKKAAGR